MTVTDLPARSDGDELAVLAREGLSGSDDASQDALDIDVEVPAKILFIGTSMDDVDGKTLGLGDEITVLVRGHVVGTGDVQMKDYVRHEVKVRVESVKRQNGPADGDDADD